MLTTEGKTGRFDRKLYKFSNDNTQELFIGTRYDFCQKYKFIVVECLRLFVNVDVLKEYVDGVSSRLYKLFQVSFLPPF